jgi:PAS domain S-box-containing protein
MRSADVPVNEVDRLIALQNLGVLDSKPEEEFDALVRAASLVCDVPISLISLVDAQRQWFKANIGLTGASETPRDIAFCAHAILEDEIFIVRDATQDHRFFDNPLVAGQPNIRFYAGAPITLSDGNRVGTLCVIDTTPRELDSKQIEILKLFAVSASKALEGRRAAREQKILAIALTESKRLLDQTGAIASVGGWELDTNSGFCSWTDQACRIHGVSPGFAPSWEQAISFFEPNARQVIQFAVQNCISTGKDWDLQFPLNRSDGERIWVRIVGTAVRVDGKTERIVGAYQDLTQSKLSKDQLTLLEKAMNAVNDIVLITEAEPFELPGPRILYVNDAFERRTGFTREEAIGQTPRILQGPGTQRDELDRVYKSLKQWKSVRTELINYTKHGDPYWLEMEIHPIANESGWFTHWVAVERDITERKQSEAQLGEARSSAIAASEAKSQFLANMSHEIRTPMNAILGMLTLLGNTPLASNQYDYVNKAEGAAKALLGLINDILDFSKIDAGKLELDPRPFRIDRLMRDLAVVLSANVGAKNTEVIYDIDPVIPQLLVGDSMRLSQVLLNLASNAIKFTAVGQVVISLKLDAQELSPSRSLQISFEIQDSGIGIAPENQAKIFSGFEQAETSTSRRFGGTGLGLAISERLVQLMGGQIKLESEVGFGSKFSFTLQMSASTLDEEVEGTKDALLSKIPMDSTTVSNAWTKQNRVLLIDDNPVALEVISKMMRSFGWLVDVAVSGQDGLDRIAENLVGDQFPFDCVYIDWQMPHMNGWETLRRLQNVRRSTSGPLPKIVMLSANGRDDLSHRTQAEQNQLNAFLVKPVTASMLMDASLQSSSDSETLRSTPRSSRRQLAGMRILVAEDNAINQQVAEELLSFEGAIVSIVGDGRQAVNAVDSAKKQFDVVLMDVQMPVMDGLSATHAIREDLGLKVLPIIGLTANAMASDRAACLASGMSEHVGKPFDMANLVSMLIRLTGFQPVPDERGTANAQRSQSEILEIALPEPVLTSPDIDLGMALKRMGGMHSLYVRTAVEFQKSLVFLASNLGSLLESADLNQAEALLHGFKGNAGTLGLTRLFELLGRLEKLCRDERDIQLIQFQSREIKLVAAAAFDAIDRALEILEKYSQPKQTPPAAPQGNAQAAAYLLSTIIPLLEANDLSVLEAFSRGRNLIDGLPEQQVGQLEFALQDLDLESALKICKLLVAESRD